MTKNAGMGQALSMKGVKALIVTLMRKFESVENDCNVAIDEKKEFHKHERK